MDFRGNRSRWIIHDYPGKPKLADSTLGPGKGFLPFRVGFDQGINRTLGPQGPFLLSTYFGSTFYNTGFATRFSSRTVKIHSFQICQRPIPKPDNRIPSLY